MRHSSAWRRGRVASRLEAFRFEPGHTAFELRMLRNAQDEDRRKLGLLIERITLEVTKEVPRKQVGT